MCNIIFTFCPTCSKVAAPSRVEKCPEKMSLAMRFGSCPFNEVNRDSKDPCVSCARRLQEQASLTRAHTRDILEEMCLKIPGMPPAPPPKDPILPNWKFETLIAIQTEELFLDHITRYHSVEIKNREGLTSQRDGLPLCLVAGVARKNRTSSRIYQRPQRFNPLRVPRVENGQAPATIALAPSAWNNRRRISRLGIAPRAKSLQASPPAPTIPICLVPGGAKQKTQLLQQDCMVPPLTPLKPLKVEIPARTPAPGQPQSTDSTHLTPGSSSQERFSAASFAQIPSHFDLRPGSVPPPLHIPTLQQRVKERERRDTLDQIHERARQRRERESQERQKLEQQTLEQQRERQELERQERERLEREDQEHQQLESQRLKRQELEQRDVKEQELERKQRKELEELELECQRLKRQEFPQQRQHQQHLQPQSQPPSRHTLKMQRIRDFQDLNFEFSTSQSSSSKSSSDSITISRSRSANSPTPSQSVNDVQFRSVRPKRSMRILPKLRSFSPLRGIDA